MKAHRALRRGAEPGDDPQHRRLSSTVGAQQGEGLAALDVEAHVEEHLHRAVGEVDARHRQRRAPGRGRAAIASSSACSRVAARRPP
ncbi:MAG: hypothetical protein V9F03_10550 [Microthrixaceae bacterium]